VLIEQHALLPLSARLTAHHVYKDFHRKAVIYMDRPMYPLVLTHAQIDAVVQVLEAHRQMLRRNFGEFAGDVLDPIIAQCREILSHS
jgi:hypothetical protein